MFHRINPEEQKDSDAGSYLGRIVSVKDDVVEYREWVASVWSAYSAPLITQVSPSVPTYASIANRHVHPGIFKTQGMTSQDVSKRSTTWPRSQSNVETLVSEHRMTMEKEQQALVKHPSANCLYALGGGIEMKLNTNSVWSETSVRKLADSLAQDNVAKRKANSETKIAGSAGTPKSFSNSKCTNLSETSCSSEMITYSEVTKQSTTSTSKSRTVSASGPDSTKTCVVDSISKPKTVSLSAKSPVADSSSKSKTLPVSGPPSTKTFAVDLTSKSKALYVSGQASTKTSVVDSTPKAKTVSVSGPMSCGSQKRTDELRTSVSNNNVSCKQSPKKLRF